MVKAVGAFILALLSASVWLTLPRLGAYRLDFEELHALGLGC